MGMIDDNQFCDNLRDLISDLSEWSQQTFGSDTVRGPVGPLKHLAKEALEAADQPDAIEEYADCFLLLLDACRRAKFKLGAVIEEARTKHEINKMREWPCPADDEPVEHIKPVSRHSL